MWHCFKPCFISGKSFAASLTKSCNKILNVFEILQKRYCPQNCSHIIVYVCGCPCMQGSNETLCVLAYIMVSFPVCSNGTSVAAGDGKTSGSPLTQWTEVQNHPGLICALSQNTSNPCVLMVKPNCIQVHELKAPPNKAKVQGMVALRQPPAGGDPVSPLNLTSLSKLPVPSGVWGWWWCC